MLVAAKQSELPLRAGKGFFFVLRVYGLLKGVSADPAHN